jgi:hypothetical protein
MTAAVMTVPFPIGFLPTPAASEDAATILSQANAWRCSWFNSFRAVY